MNKLVVLSALAICLGSGLHAQDVFATIEGTILDPAEAAVARAKITVTNVDRNQVVRTLTSDGSGIYSATLLPIGNYSVKVEATGFKTETRTGIVLNVADDLKINIKLEVGAVSESVEVKEQTVQVETSNATAATTIDGTQVRELALRPDSLLRERPTLLRQQLDGGWRGQRGSRRQPHSDDFPECRFHRRIQSGAQPLLFRYRTRRRRTDRSGDQGRHEQVSRQPL
jgi:carbon monoxide dehydrogenase subunit G